MSLYYKGIKLEEGAKHYFNGTHIKDVYIRTPNDSDYIHVYHYDSSLPTLTLSSPTAGDVISANRRTFIISGTVSDTDSGIASVTINDVPQTLEDNSFTFTTGNDTQDYVIKVTDNADNVLTKTIKVARSNYDSVRHWSDDKSGRQAYQDYSQCNVCGRYGASESKWVANGQPVHQNESSSWFNTCPNGPHHKYTISIN